MLCPELDAETNASPSPLLVHVGGKDAQQTPSARGVSRWSARSGRHVVLCPELDAETNASPSPLLFLKQGAASGVHAVSFKKVHVETFRNIRYVQRPTVDIYRKIAPVVRLGCARQ